MKPVALNSIRTDGGTQARAALNPEVIAEYAEVLNEVTADLPPVTVYFDGQDYWLADGFHRFNAYKGKGRDLIPAEVREGKQRDAIFFAAGANCNHGLRRSNEDKRRAVELMLADAEWSGMSNRAIAKHCVVSDVYVGQLRNPPAPRPVQPRAPTGGAEGKVQTFAPASTPPPAPLTPAEPTEAEKVAQEAHGEVDLVEALEETQAALEQTQRELTAATADDKAAELVKWQRIADVAARRQDELSGELKVMQDLLTKATKTIARIGRVVGEDDPSKIAATVEQIVRRAKPATA